MTTIALKNLNIKLKSLPDNLLHDLEAYVEFLSFKAKLKTEDTNFINELQHSLHQVKQMQDGTLPKQSIKEFLDEL